MPDTYLDMETTGLEPEDSKIISVQYAALERGTGRQLGGLTILREWELGERGMLNRLITDTPVIDPAFVPVGFNLPFKRKFLLSRSRMHGLPEINLPTRPGVDLHDMVIRMNGGRSKGANLAQAVGIPPNGPLIPEWYAANRYDDIEKHIRAKASGCIRLYESLQSERADRRRRLRELDPRS